MIILTDDKYEYQGITDENLYKFKRKGKTEWILVDRAKFINTITKYVTYFEPLKGVKTL